jgi:hypothetical protein
VVKAKAGQGVQSSATAHYIGPEVPEALTGNASRTIEAWVFNATPQGEETVFAWGRRGTTGLNCSFGHGTGTFQSAQDEVQATSNLSVAWTSVASGLTNGTYTDHPSTAGT